MENIGLRFVRWGAGLLMLGLLTGYGPIGHYLRGGVTHAGGNGRTFFATTGFTYEDRDGGTTDGQVLAATGQPYLEALETRRYDAGAVGPFLVKGRYVVTARGAVVRQSHDHQFGEILEGRNINGGLRVRF